MYLYINFHTSRRKQQFCYFYLECRQHGSRCGNVFYLGETEISKFLDGSLLFYKMELNDFLLSSDMFYCLLVAKRPLSCEISAVSNLMKC